jgi:hypothetical protein
MLLEQNPAKKVSSFVRSFDRARGTEQNRTEQHGRRGWARNLLIDLLMDGIDFV